ncbi:pectate lyase [Salipaludibacillus sp. CF4.18]|uniref:pectate lyase n=1 Tax=Salipaludibacillus sp. CF4.18 TaxID=3373081 RepID=UPI003EE63915
MRKSLQKQWCRSRIMLGSFIIFASVFSTTGYVSAEEAPSQSQIYEAENASGDGFIIDNQHLGYTGDGFVDYKPNEPGGYIDWTIDVEEEAKYVLAFRYAHGKTDNRHAELQVDGNIVEEQLNFPQSGDFDDYIYVTKTTELTAGEHTIRLTATAENGGANIDHLAVYRMIDITSEAEDTNNEGVVIDNKHLGFTGTGFADYNPNIPGGYLEWTVNLPASGEYNLDFRYAHAGGSERPAEVSINGTIIEELQFPPTGDWAGWSNQSLRAPLEKGENIIRLTATGAEGGGNIDHLRIHNLMETDNVLAPVITEEVELSEVVDGVTMKKLNQLGILDNIEEKQDQPVTALEFMALINNSFGFNDKEIYENMESRQDIGNIAAEDWGIYVAEVAEAHQYVPDFLWQELQPNQTLDKDKMALIIGDLMDMVSEDDEDSNMLGKLAGQGIMNPNSDHNFGIKSNMTWKEAQQLVQKLVDKSDKSTNDVNIARVDALTSNLIALTFNGTFETFDFSDVAISVPRGSWESLSPLLDRNLRIAKGAHGMDTFGNTVLILESMDELSGDKFIVEKEPQQFSGDLEEAIKQADNMLTWQMEHGGWSKAIDYSHAWDGEESRSAWINGDGVELGTIDNDATIKEIHFLSEVYAETKDERYKESVLDGIDFLMDLQYETGGFAQVFPRRGNYSDMVTFNDEAMIRVLNTFDNILDKEYPFHSGVIDDKYYEIVETSMQQATDYILEAQIEVDGVLTAWGAQHDPVTYEPVQARSYEHPSISGSESIGIVRFLMSRQNQTEEIRNAITGALQWFDESKLENTRYVSGGTDNGEYFVEHAGTDTWYRFYEIGTNKPIFSGRDGVIKHDIKEIEEERRNGYQWGGSYATQLLETAKMTGYFEGNVYARIVDTQSQDDMGKTLVEGQVEKMEDYSKQLNQIESKLIVAQDGSGDYEKVQDAINAVPDNNNQEVEILIKNGVYKEVLDIPADKANISLIGENAEKTIITYDNYAGKDNGVGGTIGTSGSATAFLRADDFKAENLTFENAFDEASTDVNGKQAVAVNASGERMIFNNVRFLGNQDTLLAHSGTQYYYNSYIEGDVDFIFGAARAVFDNSTIHSLDRGSDSNNGYITAASTLVDQPYGFLFLDSELTSDAPANTVYLGRPWQPSSNPSAIANVVFKTSNLGEHIKTEGWTENGRVQTGKCKVI